MEKMRVALDIDINASPERVYDALTTQIGMWWDHSFTDSPAAIRLEPHIGGRFYEDFDGNGNGALYATVTYLQRPKEIRLTGPMGMGGAVMGNIAMILEPVAEGTKVKLVHEAYGNVTPEQEVGYGKGWEEILIEKVPGFLNSNVPV